MKKLTFVYGPVGSSKTANALMERFEYLQKGFGVTLCKPASDTRDGVTLVRSRIGLEAAAHVITPETNIISLVKGAGNSIVIVDEAQFFSAKQIEDFRELADMGYEVVCYGLKTDFRTNLFEGSKRLLELADEVKELEVVCRCGRKATINARLDDKGNVETDGDLIDCGYHYTSMCYHCWKNNTQKRECDVADTIRIQQLLKKLEHPKNAFARKRLPGWFENSKAYATMMREKYKYEQSEESLRVLYICNHLCPNLVHLISKPIPPSPSYVRREPDAMKEYTDLLFKYEFENTQAGVRDQDGNILIHGVHHSSEEFALIQEYVERMTNDELQ